MYNSDIPARAELPSRGRLIRSTLLALIAAIAILVTIVLPAEYGIDPTGIGRVLGLAEMGEIKMQLTEEAEADRQRHLESSAGSQNQSMLIDRLIGVFIASAHARSDHDEDTHSTSEPAAVQADGGALRSEDEIIATLAPGEYLEVKLLMEEGGVTTFSWRAEGGLINFDLHGHGAEGESESYDKGRGVSDRSGTLTAAFTGEHGWFWRNRDKQAVTLTLRLEGEYSELKQGGSDG